MAKYGSKTTTDHETIRRWTQERGGRPAAVRSTRKGDETGMIRVDFAGSSGGDALEEITWDEFFEKFDDSDLEFVYEEQTPQGAKSNFNRLVKRDDR
jgi:hypothetical protein